MRSLRLPLVRPDYWILVFMETASAELKCFLDKAKVNDLDPDRISYLNPSPTITCSSTQSKTDPRQPDCYWRLVAIRKLA